MCSITWALKIAPRLPGAVRSSTSTAVPELDAVVALLAAALDHRRVEVDADEGLAGAAEQIEELAAPAARVEDRFAVADQVEVDLLAVADHLLGAAEEVLEAAVALAGAGLRGAEAERAAQGPGPRGGRAGRPPCRAPRPPPRRGRPPPVRRSSSWSRAAPWATTRASRSATFALHLAVEAERGDEPVAQLLGQFVERLGGADVDLALVGGVGAQQAQVGASRLVARLFGVAVDRRAAERDEVVEVLASRCERGSWRGARPGLRRGLRRAAPRSRRRRPAGEWVWRMSIAAAPAPRAPPALGSATTARISAAARSRSGSAHSPSGG